MERPPLNRLRHKLRERGSVYRHGYAPEFFLFISSLWVLLSLAVLLLAPPLSWVVIPPFLAIAAFMWRMSRVGARLELQGVRIVRMFKTVKIPWAEFHQFVIRPKADGELVPLDKVGYAERTDGSLEWIQGIGPWGPYVKDTFGVEAIVREMNHRAVTIKANPQGL